VNLSKGGRTARFFNGSLLYTYIVILFLCFLYV